MQKSSRSWTRGETRFSPTNDPAESELARVRAAVAQARRYLPAYATGAPASTKDIHRLADAVGLQMHVAADPMDAPAVLLPRWRGAYRLIIAPWISGPLLRHVLLHETAHVLGGDIEEPTVFAFSGPLPESEEVADLFALLGILDAAELDQGAEYVEARIRELVPLDNYGWQTYRVPRLAHKVVGLTLAS